MTEQNDQNPPQDVPNIKEKIPMQNRSRLLMLLLIVIAVVSLIIQNIDKFSNILLTIIGFGTVVLIHEFGHFIVAKLSDIKVERFSIGFPPYLFGIQRTEKGRRLRILPGFLITDPQDKDADGSLAKFHFGDNQKAGDTEYCLGLIPFGGFVKMLGQDDTKPVQDIDDPRAYPRKSPFVRMRVVAAGVICNALFAMVILIAVFLHGIKLMPPVVGGVVPDSPAQRAGLQGGDEVIAIDGRSYNLDFSDIMTTAVFLAKNENATLTIRHQDGTTEDFSLTSTKLPGSPLKGFGIYPPLLPVIPKLKSEDANQLKSQTGLEVGDRVRGVDGRNIDHVWEFDKAVETALKAHVNVVVERSPKGELVETSLDTFAGWSEHHKVLTEAALSHIGSMVPRLKVAAFSPVEPSFWQKIRCWFTGEKLQTIEDANLMPQAGDIIVKAGDVNFPTYRELKDVITEHADQRVTLEVIRDQNIVSVQAVPRRTKDADNNKTVMIGAALVLDMAHPVMAKSIDTNGEVPGLDIPRGATIQSVNGEAVTDFYDVIDRLRANTGESIPVQWRYKDRRETVQLNVEDFYRFVTVRTRLSDSIPFKPMERLYKASGTVEAMRMGIDKGVGFIKTAYITLLRFVMGAISAANFQGPIGIIHLSFTIVSERPLIEYVYFLGLINVFIAVFNALPMLPFDGGHIVMLLIEKIKGSPVPEKIQAALLYVGLALVLTLALYVTFNDILRLFNGFS